MLRKYLLSVILIALTVSFAGCGGGGGGGKSDPINLWTWVSGSDTINQKGSYGTKGTAASGNVPGARGLGISWTDSSGNLWLFGGYGYDKDGNIGMLNDLWKFDGTNWTWVSGSETINQKGSYGTKGTAASGNVPGARSYNNKGWFDSTGNLWLFGGYGYDKDGNIGMLNDLWKFDGTNWTWVSGSDINGQSGTYGTKGTVASTNVPGARYWAITWADSSGNFWIFGGGDSSSGYLNDLWKFDGTNWTWVSGSDAVNQTGMYGTKGTAASTNVPGARYSVSVLTDSSGNFWFFGGYGFDSAGDSGSLNDLWKFDGTNWTWVSGSDAVNQKGVYGTQSTADAANVPGARDNGSAWTDSSGNFWIFGGNGYDNTDAKGSLNDLWKFDGTNWTWVSGSDAVNQKGVYGTQGTADAANVPGARYECISWIDSEGSLWIFGGSGYNSTGGTGCLNDLWKYEP